MDNTDRVNVQFKQKKLERTLDIPLVEKKGTDCPNTAENRQDI